MTALLPALLLATAASAEVERQLLAMGTVLTVRVRAADRATELAASEAMVRAVEDVQRRLSDLQSGSELSALNSAPLGAWVELSPALEADLALVTWCNERTDGAFDPTLGRLEGLELADGRARRTTALTLDPGGFGKGVALDAALAAALDAGADAAFADLGGQIAVTNWPVMVDVAHPVRRDRTVASLGLLGGSVATSGQGEQSGHIRDPRTLRAAGAFGSVSVRAATATLADCLATGLFVMGPDAAEDWAADQEEVSVLVVRSRGPFPRVRLASAVAP